MKTTSVSSLVPTAAGRPEAVAVPAAQVAHGLNNPLAVIAGFRYAKEIQRVGQHVAEVTHQLLTRTGPPSPPPAKASRATRTVRGHALPRSDHETILLVEDDAAARDTIAHELAV